MVRVMRNRLSNMLILLMFLMVQTVLVCTAYSIDDVKDLKEVGIDEKLGDTIPLDLEFYDTNSENVKLNSFFLEKKPVILSLVYYSCPRVCNFATDGVVDVVNRMAALEVGSVDPPAHGEHVVQGDVVLARIPAGATSVKALTNAVGFRYKKEGNEFAHPSSLIIITPDGMISRYLNGIQHEPKDLRMALLEATNGEIGTSRIINKALLFCYQFDPVGKKYALAALKVVKAGGVITLLCLGAFLTYFWKREKRL